MVRTLERLILAGVFAAVFLAPWLFGAVEPWAIHMLTALLFVLLALWGVKTILERAVRVHPTPTHGVLLGALLVAALQIAGTPTTARDGRGRTSAGAEASGGEYGPKVEANLSRSYDPSGTRQAMWRLAMLLGYFGLAHELLRGPRRHAAAAVGLMILGSSLAVVGMIQKFAGNGRLLWIREVEAVDLAFGPFVNRNHAAGFLEMLFPLPLALIVGRGVARERWGICGFLALVMGTALVLTGSRGGLLVLGAELVLLPLLWGRMEAKAGRSRRFSVLITATVGAGIALGVLWIGAEPIVSRWTTIEGVTTVSADPLNRPTIWRATWEMIRDHVWWGVGLGAYGVAYTRYDRSAGLARVEQAHNEYLQLVAELGVWGVGLLLAAFLALRRTFRRALGPMPTGALASPSVRGERALALGVTVALIGIGIHSAFDFNLQVTSNALLCLFLLALLENLGADATGHPSRRRGYEASTHHGDHGTGRILSGGVPPGEGL